MNALPGLERLYASAPCGLLVAGGGGRLLDVNDTLCAFLRRERADLLGGLRLQDLLTMGGRIFHQTHLAPLLRMQGSVAEVKLELVRGDGTIVPMIVNATERMHEGELLMHAALFVAEDRHKYEQELLLQRRRAEELLALHERDQAELAAARAQAEDRAQLAEQMMGIVSHDLRNPLSTINLSATPLTMGGASEAQRVVIERIERAVQRSERLISDLLDLTQARIGGGLRLSPRPGDLHAVVGDAVADLRTAFPGRTLVHRREGPGECAVDPDRIAQALGNLVANAVHHGDAQSPITIASVAGAAVFSLSVHNFGPPIPPQKVERLFEAMVRGESASSRGVGLGLFIVREIARAHGGDAQVHSTAADGTTFVLRLPRVSESAPPSPAA